MDRIIQGSEGEFLNLIRQAIREEMAALLPTSSQTQPRQPAGTRKEVAKHLGISIAKLDIMTKSGEIKSIKIGRQVFYRWLDLETYISKK